MGDVSDQLSLPLPERERASYWVRLQVRGAVTGPVFQAFWTNAVENPIAGWGLPPYRTRSEAT